MASDIDGWIGLLILITGIVLIGIALILTGVFFADTPDPELPIDSETAIIRTYDANENLLNEWRVK